MEPDMVYAVIPALPEVVEPGVFVHRGVAGLGEHAGVVLASEKDFVAARHELIVNYFQPLRSLSGVLFRSLSLSKGLWFDKLTNRSKGRLDHNLPDDPVPVGLSVLRVHV